MIISHIKKNRFFTYIRSKYIYRFLGIFLILLSAAIFVFGIVSYNMSSTVISNDYVNYKKQINRQLAENLDENINNLSRQSIASLLLIQDINYIITASNTDDRYFEKILMLNTYYFSLLQSTPKVFSVTIFDRDKNIKFYKDVKNQSNSKNTLESADWFDETVTMDGQQYFLEPHVNDYVFNNRSSDSKAASVISICRALKQKLPNTDILGVIVYEQLTDEFLKELYKTELEADETLVLLGQKGDILYTNVPVDSDLLKTLSENAQENHVDTYSHHLQGQELLITQSKTAYGLTLVSIIPSQVLNARSNFIWNINFTVLLVVLILSIIIFFIISYFFSKPFTRLDAAIKNVKRGDFSTTVHIKGSHEISQIGNTFNDMVANINDLIQQKYHTNLLRKQAELEYLQSQINPHFLYNTLSSIMNISDQGDKEKTSKMLLNLSDIFRYSLSKGRHIVKFHEELLHLKKYLELQEIRYAGIYKVTYDIAPEISNYDILRFTLQPIVENAIYHGLEGVRGNGEICITAKVFEDTFNIYIYDSGKGIPPNELSTMNSLLKNWTDDTSAVHSTKVGIYNVNARIKLHFGEEYGLKITSKPGVSTTVKITLPIELPPKRG